MHICGGREKRRGEVTEKEEEGFRSDSGSDDVAK